MVETNRAYMHPDHGPVFVTSGSQYINGRVSNYFEMRAILPDGTLGDEFCGYGSDMWLPLPGQPIFTWRFDEQSEPARCRLAAEIWTSHARYLHREYMKHRGNDDNRAQYVLHFRNKCLAAARKIMGKTG